MFFDLGIQSASEDRKDRRKWNKKENVFGERKRKKKQEGGRRKSKTTEQEERKEKKKIGEEGETGTNDKGFFQRKTRGK